ncbi:MAG TPA: ABC transporter ATP-binding protein [Longimicrobiales bacterium]|nr:ABC transporter ATP-binding protein [Longimicrobiales bacterium]
MREGLPSRILADSYGVRTTQLSKRFGSLQAVDGVELNVPLGAFYLLVGPNGAGKTTTFRMLLGLLAPDAGHAEVAGIESTPDGLARAHIGLVPETENSPYPYLRVDRLLAHEASYRGTWDDAYARELVKLLEVPLSRPFGKLSKGQARRVRLVCALAHRPSVLLLDEPTDGLDPVARDTVQRVLTEHLADTPTTVLVATHLVHEMERLADHIGVMRSGRLVAQLSIADLDMRLRRYEFEAPDGWSAPASLAVGRRNGSPHEHRWTMWGDETGVATALRDSGARVRSAQGLSLEDATVALLTWEES